MPHPEGRGSLLSFIVLVYLFLTTMDSVKDYIFIDENRVFSYYKQISSPDDLKRDHKCPSWGASMSIGGPKISWKQSSSARDPTIYECIETVEDYLENSDLIVPINKSLKRWEENNRSAFFVRDNLSGKRAIIQPPKEAKNQGIDPIALWILNPINIDTNESRYHKYDQEIRSFMIESPSQSDTSNVPGRSGFTAIEFIIRVLHKDNQQLRRLLTNNGDSNNTNKHDGTSDSEFRKFANSPEEYLEALGSKLSSEKDIRTLFRVRFIWDEDGYHDAPPHSKMGIVGYPLYIYKN